MSQEKNNILFSQFMELPKRFGDWFIHDGIVCNIWNMEYHSNWAWLMPVIVKIGKIILPDDRYPNGNRIFVEKIYPQTFGMLDEDGMYMFRFKGYSLHKDETLIGVAHKAVVEVLENLPEYSVKS